jgi:hypothetical protein
MLKPIVCSDELGLYELSQPGPIRCLIATTPETRSICNDPQILGTEYTRRLQRACARILSAGGFTLTENSTAVINILRGGLNFGLRDALADAFGWKAHTTCFISAQRARDTADPEEWHITENAYRKVYFPQEPRLVIGDVVATGTSLRYGLNELVASAKSMETELQDIVFFTIGGAIASKILDEVDTECRRLFPNYRRTVLVYFEGCFGVPDLESRLMIRLTGTDLTRGDAIMAPEFIESQYENPSYPIERCTIYDAGSRAFHVSEYAEDVRGYWKQVLDLADQGVTFEAYLKDRFPSLDASRFVGASLREIAVRQINAMASLLQI